MGAGLAVQLKRFSDYVLAHGQEIARFVADIDHLILALGRSGADARHRHRRSTGCGCTSWFDSLSSGGKTLTEIIGAVQSPSLVLLAGHVSLRAGGFARHADRLGHCRAWRAAAGCCRTITRTRTAARRTSTGASSSATLRPQITQALARQCLADLDRPPENLQRLRRYSGIVRWRSGGMDTELRAQRLPALPTQHQLEGAQRLPCRASTISSRRTPGCTRGLPIHQTSSQRCRHLLPRH